MPIYHVQAPDGSVLQIEGPADPQPGEIEAAAQHHYNVMQTEAQMRKEYSPVSDDLGENVRAGMGAQANRIIQGAKGLWLKATGTPEEQAAHQAEVDEQHRLEQPLRASRSGQAGTILGDVAMTAIPGGAAVRGASAGAAALGAGRTGMMLAGLAGAGAAGAGYRAAQAPLSNETIGGNALQGAAEGVTGQAIGNVLGRAIGGIVNLSRAARAMPQAVQDASTLGQVADRTTFAGRLAAGLEEKARSLPLVGAAIDNARARGMNAWRANVLDEVSPQGFRPAADTTREAMEQIQDEFGRRYGAALQGQVVDQSRPFVNRVARVTADPRNGLTAEQGQQIQDMVGRYYNQMFSSPNVGGTTRQISAEEAKNFERYLTAQARSYRMSNVPQAQQMAQVFDDIEHAWTVGYRSQLPLSVRQQLSPLDARYAPFKTAERAATYVGNDMGNFTPSQLKNAVKSRTTQAGFARGDGMLQQQAENGRQMYLDRIPDSGTSGRVLGAAGLAGLVMDPMTTLTTAGVGAGVVVPTLTTRAGKNLMTGGTRIQRLLQQLRADQILQNAGAPIGTLADSE